MFTSKLLSFTRLQVTSVRSSQSVPFRGFHNSGKLHEPVIVAATRTPVGSLSGSLSSFSAPELGAFAVKEALQRSGVKPDQVTEVILGNVLSANIGQAPARQASLKAGIPESVPCTTVNKVCSSGMKTIMFGAQSIMLGHNDIVVAGGFESMSNAPYYLEKARQGYKYGHGQLLDAVLKDGLTDVYNNVHMGICAETCAAKYGFSRADQDKYAIESYKRSADAQKNGAFKSEMVAIKVKGRTGEVVVQEDEEVKNLKLDKIPSLKPAFKNDGTVTAANASKLNDGASCVILMSAEKARALGIKPLARIIGFADAEQAPIDFPTAPALAIPKALARAGLKISDIDYFEINEAFSVVALANAKILNIPLDRLNVNGGGVALGHPIGASGGRLVVHLSHMLRDRNARYGVASICNGGGGASAVVIEKL